MEGNNVSQLDQLYYLKRCSYLTDVNLKYNPVAKELLYYSKIQENIPKIENLDEEEINEGFFDKKVEISKRQNMKKNMTASSKFRGI